MQKFLLLEISVTNTFLSLNLSLLSPKLSMTKRGGFPLVFLLSHRIIQCTFDYLISLDRCGREFSCLSSHETYNISLFLGLLTLPHLRTLWAFLHTISLNRLERYFLSSSYHTKSFLSILESCFIHWLPLTLFAITYN